MSSRFGLCPCLGLRRSLSDCLHIDIYQLG
jgi:hypothetical protein